MTQIIPHTGTIDCLCAVCTSGLDPRVGQPDILGPEVGSGSGRTEDASVDGLAGTVGSNGKQIWSVNQIAQHLNRTGANWTGTVDPAPQRGDADVRNITYSFFGTQQQLFENGYVYFVGQQGFGLSEYFNFASFNNAQKDTARKSMQYWDDLINITLTEVANPANGDINFGNLASAPTTQAYARLPFGTLTSDAAINAQIRGIAGDIWVSASQASNFQLQVGGYGFQTLTHEIGHSLGLSHPGAYNAAPGVSITYGVNAEYYQDLRSYSVMSYFNASEVGSRHFDFHISTTVYAATPLVHDIAAIQRMYGADMTTRTGDTTYGFNSNAGRDAFDFTKTKAPVIAIWDAGGIDTLDASGYATDQVIDLRAGSLSNIGGVTFDTAPSFEQVNANRAAAGFGAVSRATYDGNMNLLRTNPVVGRLTDNVAIAYGVTIENSVGGSGNDTMFGNDVANVISGNAGNDNISAFGGNDTIDGGAGNDTMAGGLGDDTYAVDSAGDIVNEAAGEGNDRILTTASFILGANSEIELLSTANQAGTTALNLTGNGFGQTIIGNDGVNVLMGMGGNDTLCGGGGNDVLDGGTGADTGVGGAGDDTYNVDNAGDSVIEAAGQGNDRVLASVDYRLTGGAEVELLSAANQAGTTALTLTGNDFAQAIIGNEGVNSLNGNGGADTLYGLGGNDVIDGGTGADTAFGGTGDDVYNVDDAGDRVFENAGEGNDRILTSVSYTLAAGVSVELLAAADQAGAGALNLTGNDEAQSIIGNEGVNVLLGGGGNDTLYALGGNDELDGGTGADNLFGGTGNDVYRVDNAGDFVVERAGEGVDELWASVSYVLAADAEVEQISVADRLGTAAIDLTGSNSANIIFGNEGVNVLSGRGGNDTIYAGGGGDTLDGGTGADMLYGGEGADRFMFTSALGANEVDGLREFQVGIDKIVLDDAIFTALGIGAVSAGAFVLGTAAQDADDRLIYDQATGRLFYDADGNGAGAAVLFAELTVGTALTATDFQVI
jgi:serralysin